MRILSLSLVSTLLVACGGSVSSEGLNGGSSGTGAGGSGGTATGGSSGTGAVAGSGAVSGSGGVSGGGGTSTGGTGGGEFCCENDAQCNPESDFWTNQCVEGECLPIPTQGSCWTQEDCFEGQCTGACVCPCGFECDCGGQLGKCISPEPPLPGACCKDDFDCGDILFVPCVNNVCKMPVPNQCWSDAECFNGTSCVGEFVCPCAADCAAEDKPGICQ